MEQKNNRSDNPNQKAISNRPMSKVIEWDNRAKSFSNADRELSPYAQNNMNDARNPYNHVTKPNNRNDSKITEIFSNNAIINRGSNNLAPQYDIEIGLKSITHRRIAEGLSRLVAGKRFSFYIDGLENGESPSAEQQAMLNMAEAWNDIGLEDGRPIMAAGMVYFRHFPLIISQKKARLVQGLTTTVAPVPLYFNAKPSQQFRYCKPEITKTGQIVNTMHAYHDADWGFTGCELPNAEPTVIPLMPISAYIEKSGALDAIRTHYGASTIPGYTVKSMEYAKSHLENFISVSVSDSESIFDNAYPLPEWKTNSSLNSIEGEFQASCVNIDYLRNGLHIFAIVNVYSTDFRDTMGTEDAKKPIDPNAIFKHNEDLFERLKGSYNSGKIIMNPVVATEQFPDGTIEIKEIKLEFPYQAVQFFNEESRAAILTAWGVMADLFSISKPEKNNLRSQEGFMAMGIVLLQEKVRKLQSSIEKGINKMLKYYGLKDVRCSIVPEDMSSYIVVLREFAEKYMTINEVRETILGIDAIDEQVKAELAKERQIVMGVFKEAGAIVEEPPAETE